jgi:hypothetical protein
MRLTLLSLFVAASSQASITLSYNQTANNALWSSAPSGYNTNSYEYIPTMNGSYSGRQGYGFYDAFSIQAQGDANASISSITLGFHFAGLFDDSIAIDVDGDGAIDYALSYWNLDGAYSGYQPWNSLADATNVGIVLTITASGTTAQSYVYGQTVSSSGSGYYNSLASITLSTLGLASLDANGDATSIGSLRVGFLNVAGNGGGTPSLSSGSFNYNPLINYAVPEPSTYGLALGGLALAVVALRRNKSSK